MRHLFAVTVLFCSLAGAQDYSPSRCRAAYDVGGRKEADRFLAPRLDAFKRQIASSCWALAQQRLKALGK
jgi:hypothetical protein